MDSNFVSNHNNVHSDLLWYFMDLTKVNRLFTKSSVKEFLLRYFLIADLDLERVAEDFIDHEILISGSLNNSYFEITLTDFKNFIGYAINENPFNIIGSTKEFSKEYFYKRKKVSQFISEDGHQKLSEDALIFGFLGLENLFHIDSLSIHFKRRIKNHYINNHEKVALLVDFILNKIPEELFIDKKDDYKGKLYWMFDCYDSSNKIQFEPYDYYSHEELLQIADLCEGSESRDYFESYDTIDADFKSDYSIIREHIIFAYGVKNGYIKLSREYKKIKVMQECYNPYLQLNFDHLYLDGWNFSTQQIYDDWNMDKWMHLIPKKA